MRCPGVIIAYLEHRRDIDTACVVLIIGVMLYEIIQKLNRTLDDVLAHDIVDLTLAREVLKDAVGGLVLFHTEIILHGDIKPLSIVQYGSSWKLTGLHISFKTGDATRNVEKYNWGYCPPEIGRYFTQFRANSHIFWPPYL